MKFAKYWEMAESESPSMCAWGWSNASPDEARTMARERLDRLLAAFKNDTLDEKRKGAYYGVSRPPREEVVEEIHHGEAQEPVAIVSRNSYGCLVLNAEGFAMIDLDLPANPGGMFGGILKLFGGKDPKVEAEEKLKQKVDEWMLLSKRKGRLYRTAAGFRLILTDRLEDPASKDFQRHMEDLQADPLFRHLCKGQASFRARLTPKPWRMNGMAKPQSQYPWAKPGEKEAYEAWLGKYNGAIPAFAVCEKVQDFGSGPENPLIARLLKLHDGHTLNPGKPLA